MKYSRQRELIRNAVVGNDNHPTADDIYQIIRAENPTISLATVYRNLKNLAEAGEIQKLTFPIGADRFDYHTKPHCHIQCTKCGSVFDLEPAPFDQLDRFLEEQDGFTVTGYSLTVYGLCRQCCKESDNTTL